MPSLLAKAAMAALAGGRKLDGSGVSPCSHDICGRKLLQIHATSGPKFLKAGSDPVYDGNNLLGRQAYAGDYADEDFIVTDIDMDENGHNLAGNPAVTASIVNDQIKFELQMDNTYTHTYHDCALKISPSIIGGEFLADGVTDKKLTSATFNPYNSGSAPYASVANVNGTWAYDSGSSGPGKFTAVVADPVIDKSLGYLGLEFDVEIDCAYDKSGVAPSPTSIYHHTIVDANGVGTNPPTYQKLRVRHKFVEDSTNVLSLLSDSTTPITLTDPAAQWGSGTHKKMPVNIEATTTVQTEAGAVRFPAGEWEAGGAFGELAKTSGAKLSCQLNQGTLVSALDDVKGNWFNEHAGKYGQVQGGAVQVEADYGNLEDVSCDSDTTGVSCGIKYTATIDPTTERALGFQVPLASYYESNAGPSVSCTETQNAASTGTTSKDVDITGRGADHKLGDIKKSLTFTGNEPTITDYGEGFFTLDSGANEKVFGNDKLISVAQSAATSWYDLADTYDYTWALKYKIGQSEFAETDAESTDSQKIALAGADLSSVQSVLFDKTGTYIARTKFARPTQYGEQRDHYHIVHDGAPVAEATAAFRRSKAEIDLTITGQNDGTLDYDGAVSAISTIGFPGYNEEFVVGDATITACDYCSGNVNDVNNNVKIDPALTGTEQNAEWQLFEADNTAGKTDTALFDQTAAICDGTESTAWCKSKATATDTVGRGDKVQCKVQSVTFEATATMQDEDDRVASSSVVTKTYTDAALGEPIKPTTQPRSGIQYQIAGAQLTQEFTNVALEMDEQNIGAQTFTRPHGEAQAYSCSEAAGTVFTYTSPYYHFCNASVSDPIEYDVATNVVYSDAQVKVGAALTAGSAGTSGHTIREYDIQGRQTDAPGVDIKFTVTASTDTHGLKFDETLQVKVKHAALDGGETVLSPGHDQACIIAPNQASAVCTLEGFKDPSFDPSDKLDINDHCVVGANTANDEVECPSFALEVSQEFNVPNTDPSVGAFQSAVVQDTDTCATERRHIISLANSSSAAEDIVISIDVDGSEEIHNELVELFATFGGSEKEAFATAAAETGAQSTGTAGEYQTIMALEADATRDGATLLPSDMTLLNLNIKVHGEDVAASPVTYTVRNEGRPEDYKMYLCQNGNNYNQCMQAEFPSGGQQYVILGDGSSAGSAEIYVRIDDAAGTGADPCRNKMKGVQAFGEGIKFSIARNGEQKHTYTVPIICHTPDVPTISVVSGPVNNGINWNQELLTVEIEGRSIDSSQSVTISGLTNTLEQDVNATLETDVAEATYRQAVLLLPFVKNGCDPATAAILFDDATALSQALTCPVSALGVEGIVRNALVTPQHVFGDILALPLSMTGRDANQHNGAVTLRSSTGDQNLATGETVVFMDASNSEVQSLALPDAADTTTSPETVYIKIKPGSSGRIQCNFIEIQLSAQTNEDANSVKDFEFRMNCPRQQDSKRAIDQLTLKYDVTKFTYSHTLMEIDTALTPSGLTSTIALGKCDGTNLVKSDDAACDLLAGENDKAGGEAGLDLFHTCRQHDSDGTVWSGDTIVSKATVARQYTKPDAVFGETKFCGETPLSLSVTKTKTTSISIAVADNSDMRFDVHMSELAWIEDTNTCTDGQYRLFAKIDTLRQLGVNGATQFEPAEGEEYVSDGIKTFYRDGLDNVVYYKDGTGSAIAADAHQVDTGASFTIVGDCGAADSTMRSIDFVMKVSLDGVDYFSHASIGFKVTAPDSDSDALDFMIADTTALTECGLVGADFTGSACDQSPIPSNFQVKLSVGVSAQEAAAFRHEYSAPRIKRSGIPSEANCDLFGADPNVADCPLVSSLTPAAEYQAKLSVSGTEEVQDLVQGTGDDANSIVMLKTVQFAGDQDVQIGWIISRVENPNGAGRRLRSVQHVSYTLGADGSVSKSSSFAVLPAVRDSDGASAITTQEQITEQELLVDGSAAGDPRVYNRTTVQHDKSGEDHTLAVLGIVFGGLGSVAAIAVAFFVGCASRRDAGGVGSSFKTVAGGYSDRQPLFNRNRFAPGDF